MYEVAVTRDKWPQIDDPVAAAGQPHRRWYVPAKKPNAELWRAKDTLPKIEMPGPIRYGITTLSNGVMTCSFPAE